MNIRSYRILRWIDEEEDRLKASGEDNLQYVILDMGGEYESEAICDILRNYDTWDLKLVYV